MLEFHGDAIVLSGITGTRIKCEIIGGYYPLWWSITSGGQQRDYNFQTAIVDLNAATGENYIEETKQVIPGSAGHALQLKMDNQDTSKLKIILVEEDDGCYQHLKKVIQRKWPNFHLDEAEGSLESNKTGVYLINKDLNGALNDIAQIELGNSLFFFDPLLYTSNSDIEEVAKNRIERYYKIGRVHCLSLHFGLVSW